MVAPGAYVIDEPVIVALAAAALTTVTFYKDPGVGCKSTTQRVKRVQKAAAVADHLRESPDFAGLSASQRSDVAVSVGTPVLELFQRCAQKDTKGCYLLVRSWLDDQFGVSDNNSNAERDLVTLLQALRIALTGLPFRSEGSDAVAGALALAGRRLYDLVVSDVDLRGNFDELWQSREISLNAFGGASDIDSDDSDSDDVVEAAAVEGADALAVLLCFAHADYDYNVFIFLMSSYVSQQQMQQQQQEQQPQQQ